MFSLRVLLSICLIFCQFQPGVAYKSVSSKKSVYLSSEKLLFYTGDSCIDSAKFLDCMSFPERKRKMYSDI